MNILRMTNDKEEDAYSALIFYFYLDVKEKFGPRRFSFLSFFSFFFFFPPFLWVSSVCSLSALF